MAKWLFSPLDARRRLGRSRPGVEMDPAVLSGLRALFAAAILIVYLGIAKRD